MGPKCTELSVERPEQYHFDRERGHGGLWARLLGLLRGGSAGRCCRCLLPHGLPSAVPAPSCLLSRVLCEGGALTLAPVLRPLAAPGHPASAGDQLLVSMVYFLVRLAEQPAFVAAVSAVRERRRGGERAGEGHAWGAAYWAARAHVQGVVA